MRIVLEAPFDVYSGYGQDGIDLAVGMETAGVDVTVKPISIAPGLPRSFTRLLEKDPRGEKDMLIRFAEPRLLTDYVPRGDLPQFAYTMWERTPMHPDWDFPDWQGETIAVGGDDGKEIVHESRPLDGWTGVVVTCPMNVEAFRPVVPEATRIEVAPCGIDERMWTHRRRPSAGPVRFLMVGMLNGRKNPFAALEAWKRAKEADPSFDGTLHLHSLAPGLHPSLGSAYPDVTVSTAPLTKPDLLDLYHEHDVMISTSRGEGNNKPAMEFMSTGGVVMATDWSGHQNWLFSECTVPLPGRLVTAEGAFWAKEFEVDGAFLTEEILRLGRRGDDLPRLGDTAANVIRSSLTWDHCIARLLRTVGTML